MASKLIKPNTMTVEELLKDRYKAIGIGNKHYPRSTFFIGQIITVGAIGIETQIRFPDYPHLFKKLEWWEGREEKDMPEYIKISEFPHKGEYTFIHVDGRKARHEFNTGSYFGIKYQPGGGTYIGDNEPRFLPATKSEYENQNG